LSATEGIEREKQRAAEAAVELVQDGMTVGLGTGSTAAYLLAPLAARRLRIRCVATSPATAQAAQALGIEVVSFAGLEAPSRLDMTIDGADEVDPAGWLVKGGGGAHTREKAVAAASDRFIVIVSANKLVDRLTPPIPLELAEFGLVATLARLGPVQLRDATPSPDRGAIADYTGPVDDPRELAAWLSEMPGVVEHGLFPPEMVAEVLVGRGENVERITVS
jgi:ribose 5-phosphate isomerase A